MACLAGQTCRNMSFVGEVNKIGKFMNSNPLDRPAFIPGFLDLLNQRTVCFHYLMAVHANGSRRDTCMPRFFDIGMAILTRNVVIAGMNFMAEGNGLLGRITLIRGAWHNRCEGNPEDHKNYPPNTKTKTFRHDSNLLRGPVRGTPPRSETVNDDFRCI